MKKHTLYLLLLWLFFTLSASAQTTLQVVSKRVAKSFENPQVVTIDAEKADIEIVSWKKKTMEVTLQLIAKHPDKKTAEADLNLLQHIAEQRPDGIYLRNFWAASTTSKTASSSSFKAIYMLKIPEDMVLKIKNSFGKITINARTAELSLTTNFCTLQLENIGGKVTFDNRYGEVEIRDLRAAAVIRANRTDFVFQNIGGTLNLKSQYGKITILGVSNSLQNLKIESNKTEVKLKNIRLADFSFQLASSYGELKVPAEFIFKKNEKKYKQAVFNLADDNKIQITNAFGTTIIEN